MASWYKMPHMKNSLYSSLVFNQEHVFLQTQYAKCWMGPLIIPQIIEPKMSAATWDNTFLHQCWHGCAIAPPLSFHGIYFWNHWLWLKSFLSLAGQKHLCPWCMRRDGSIFGGVLFSPPELCFCSSLSFSLLSAVTPASKSKDKPMWVAPRFFLTEVLKLESCLYLTGSYTYLIINHVFFSEDLPYMNTQFPIWIPSPSHPGSLYCTTLADFVVVVVQLLNQVPWLLFSPIDYSTSGFPVLH